MDRLFKRGVRWVKKNYLLSLFALAVLFVMTVAAYKLFVARPTYIYARVKVGQGYWWAATQKPSAWYVDAIKQAANEKTKSSRPNQQVISVIYYPYYGSGQYDVYVVLKLRVSRVGPEGRYNYDRSTIGIGSPIDLEFNTVQFSGTIIQLSEKPIVNNYLEKTITLTKKNALPWELDEIVTGDTLYNGETTVARVLSKNSIDTNNLQDDSLGNYPAAADPRKYISVKVSLKGKMVNGQFVYAEDQAVTPGRILPLSTSSFVFSDYTVAGIQ